MALKLDNNLLAELGLAALPDSEKQLLLRQIYEKLEMNVGMRLADQMSNEQLDAFEKFVEANDDKGAFQWLETNFPNYKMVVNEEFEKLKAEIRAVAPQILASAQQNQSQNQSQNQGQQQAQVQQGQQPQGQPGQQPSPQQMQQPYPPQQQYPQQPMQHQQPPAAVPQGGHLQPQYGAPAGPPPQYQQQPQQPSAPQHYQAQPQQQPPVEQQPYPPQQHQQQSQQYPPFPPRQPPAGSSQQ